MHEYGPPCPPPLIAARLLLAADSGDVQVLDEICAEFLGDDGDQGCTNCTHQVVMTLVTFSCDVADHLDDVLGHDRT
jgi:hypothetical protein